MSSVEMVTVLVVCADPEQSADLVARLSDGGASVVGPVGAAAPALVLAAQCAPQVAVVAGPTEGRRGPRALSRELSRIWGVDCLVLGAAGEVAGPAAADPDRVARVRRMLGSRDPAGTPGDALAA